MDQAIETRRGPKTTVPAELGIPKNRIAYDAAGFFRVEQELAAGYGTPGSDIAIPII